MQPEIRDRSSRPKYKAKRGQTQLDSCVRAERPKHRARRGRRKRKGRRAGLRLKLSKSERLGRSHLRLLYWNCASVKQRRPGLDRLVCDADFVALQETQLGESGVLRCAGFCSFYNRRHRGMVILIREKFHATEVSMDRWDCDELQLLAVRVHGARPFLLVNVYACNAKVDSERWACLNEIQALGGQVLFCGDFNAKGQSWGNKVNNKQGEALEEVLVSADLICLNGGGITRMASRPGDEDSAIDLALASSRMSTLCKWMSLRHHGSDHLPCLVLIAIGKESRDKKLGQPFKYECSRQDIVDRVRIRIRNAKRNNHKGRRERWQLPPWWNDEVEKAWVHKRQTTARWQKGRELKMDTESLLLLKAEMRAKAELFETVANEARREKWEVFCNKIAADKSLKLFWRLHRSMNGPFKTRVIADFVNTDLVWQRTDEDKGRAFFERYIGQTQQNESPEINEELLAISERCRGQSMAGELHITVEDIKAVLKKSRNTAPGPDGIRYSDLMELTEGELEELAQAFNKSIEMGAIDESWLHSYLIPLPKPGKDHEKIQGYRIITMQNTIGKLLEKLVARRISCQLETDLFFPQTLGGYRPNRETWSNVAVLAQEVYEGFQDGLETCAVAVDLEDAYNRVPLQFLMRQLLDAHIHPLLVRWIAVALRQRRVVLRCGKWASAPATVCPGLPQGSPLSPVLFNVYSTKCVADALDGSGRTLAYVDDILIYRQGKNREYVTAELQRELNRLSDWCDTSGALVNPTKASLTWFSLNNQIGRTVTPSISIQNRAIERTPSLKYLGVVCDRSLSFNEHINSIITRARRGLTAMRVMAATFCEQRLLVILYQGLVLSALEYAAAILTLSRTQTERLEKIQNEAMRIILGCTKDTEIIAMRFLLDFPSIALRIKMWQARSYLRISADPTHLLHDAIKARKGCRLKRGKSWMGRAEDIIQQVCPLAEIDVGAEWVRVPSTCSTSFQVIITLNRVCRQDNPIMVESEVQALLSECSSGEDIIIYTDGSVVRQIRSAWAFTAQWRGKTIKEESGAYAVTTSSMTMEVMAVTRAFAWMVAMKPVAVCFLSDSMSMLRKIENGWVRRSWVEALDGSGVQSVTFIFVPGHCGVVGNERADRLANMAVLTGGNAMDRADIICNLRLVEQSRWLENGESSTSLARMKAMKVKCGVAGHERFRGRRRSLINQHRTGTISQCTLRNILADRSEHLWVCPECDDDDPT